jgi:hypothetical protein
VTALADPTGSSGPSGPSGRPGPAAEAGAAAARPLAVAGLMAAVWSVGIGLVTLTTITLAGWVAAPRAALGPGLPGVFRAAVNLWLVAHHAGFSLPTGRVGLLPLGLMILPGALLFRAGAWITREAAVPGLRKVGVTHAAFALAVPYAAMLTLLALASGTAVVRPSPWQAAVTGFLLALVAGGLGSARALVVAAGGRMSWAGLLRLLPERPRALVVGVTGATLVLLASGAVLVAASLAVHLQQAERLQAALAPGAVGGLLLFLLELVFLPNAVIWGMSYAIGPGFAVGSGTSVSPSGIFLGEVPAFPPLAALPEPGPAPVASLVVLAAPFVAGVVGGVLTIRTVPSLVPEAAPLWGFACGVLTGAVTTVLAVLSSGPLGGGRLTAMGPSAWQVGLMATLEVGVAAAIGAWAANARLLRRLPAAEDGRGEHGGGQEPYGPDEPYEQDETAPIPDHVEFVSPEPVLATGTRPAPRKRRVARDAPPEPTRKSARKTARKAASPPARSAARPSGNVTANPPYKTAANQHKTAANPQGERTANPPGEKAAKPSGETTARQPDGDRAGPATPADEARGRPARDPAAEPADQPAADAADHDAGKVENRGGAIFVLRDDVPDQRRGQAP